MRAHIGSVAMQQNLTFAVPLVATAWLVTVPAVLSPWNFLGFAGLLTALGWVARTTYQKAQPTARLARLPKGTEYQGAREHPRNTR
jgi:hypothetical protein